MKFITISNAKKQTGLSYLGTTNVSSKMVKNLKVNQLTYCLSLSPAKTSGFNVCSHSTNECRIGCLANSGRTAIEIFSDISRIRNSRIKKTRLLFQHQDFFMQWLVAEIDVCRKKALKLGYFFSVRLNIISDVDYTGILLNGKNIYEIFPDVQFYDYTKNHEKFRNKPSNYYLTYSYTGKNWVICEDLLKSGNNIAMVFNVKHESMLPAMYKNFMVVNGDLTDYRPNDGKGVIVGLKWKRIADRLAEQQIINSIFVIQPNDNDCSHIHKIAV